MVSGIKTDRFFQEKAQEAVDFIVNYPKGDKRIIVVSHFPCVKEAMDNEDWCADPAIGDILLPFSDVLVFGHTHIEQDFYKEKTRIVNVGSGYREENDSIIESMKYKILEF